MTTKNDISETEVEITAEMEIEGAHIVQCHTNYEMGIARDVAREVFLAMTRKKAKSPG